MASPGVPRQALKERMSALRQQMEMVERELERTAAATQAGAAAGGRAPADQIGRLRDALQQILKAASAPTTLNLLLTHAAREGARAILFIMRQGSLWAWSGLDRAGQKLPVARFTLAPEESPLLSSALRARRTQRADAAEAWEARLGSLSESGPVAVPLSIEGSGGLLWLDPGGDPADGAVEAVECLVTGASAVLDSIGQRKAAALAPAARVTADERAIASQLPYAVGEPAASEADTGPAPGARSAPAGPALDLSTPNLTRQHEDARRLARLLISEIKLYNEDKVVLGRKARDLYQRLREDIERSRQVYDERVAAEVRAATDYFQQELVATLAEGDASLLGPVPAAIP